MAWKSCPSVHRKLPAKDISCKNSFGWFFIHLDENPVSNLTNSLPISTPPGTSIMRSALDSVDTTKSRTWNGFAHAVPGRCGCLMAASLDVIRWLMARSIDEYHLGHTRRSIEFIQHPWDRRGRFLMDPTCWRGFWWDRALTSTPTIEAASRLSRPQSEPNQQGCWDPSWAPASQQTGRSFFSSPSWIFILRRTSHLPSCVRLS